ncbi:MAG: Tad domain-containing protein [Deltaproteobacteria bacterium]|nr:Tad domain-containing protein [Deltaproteobacteria bacterium]
MCDRRTSREAAAGTESQRGATAVFGSVALVGALGFTALVVDAGYVLVTQADLQNVADVAATSANLELGRIYIDLGKADPSTHVLTGSDEARILEAVNRVTLSNTVASEPVSIAAADINYGRWEYSDNGFGDEVTFTQSTTGPTAISVKARRDDQVNGTVQTLLASVLGVDAFALSASASGALTPLSSLPAGRVELPVGVSKFWYEQRVAKCGTDATIRLYPTNDEASCAGWHTFEQHPASASRLRSIIDGIDEGSFTSPEIVIGQTKFEFVGGTIDTALNEIAELYNHRKDANGEWRTQIPVYESYDCSNPNQQLTIVGIATVVVTGVKPSGQDKRVMGRMACSVVTYGTGGGSTDFGTRLAFPLTVE